MIEKCKTLIAAKNLVMQVDRKMASNVCESGWKIASGVMSVEISDVRSSSSDEQPRLFKVAKAYCSYVQGQFENKIIARLEDEELHEKRRFGVATEAANHCCAAHNGKGCANDAIAKAVCKVCSPVRVGRGGIYFHLRTCYQIDRWTSISRNAVLSGGILRARLWSPGKGLHIVQRRDWQNVKTSCTRRSASFKQTDSPAQVQYRTRYQQKD